jgi:ABC-type cobalamin/Fe3+-siderophores transport system ATPase subunit
MKQRIIDERSARGFSDRETRDTVWLARLSEVWRKWHDSDKTWIDALETGEAERPFDLFLVQDVGYGAQALCPLDTASSGELELVTLAGSLIIDEFQGMLVIDEPELHLHPQWQARLLPTLRSLAPDAQLIVATHSHFPWDQALPFQRLLLLPAGDPRGRTNEEPQQGSANSETEG